jgi:uncharacterized protein YkwD
LQTPPHLAGTAVRCPRCQGTLRAPAAAPLARLVPPPPPRATDKPAGNTLLVAAAVGVLALISLSVGLFGGSRRPPAGRPAAPAARAPDEGPPRATPPDEPSQPAIPADEVDALTRRVLGAINAQRRIEGRAEVRLDAGRSAGCREHARYLTRNAGRTDLDPHDQEDLPGATPAGRSAARAASVVRREPVAAVNAWLSSPGHRALLLHAGLLAVGVGFDRDGGKWVTVVDAPAAAPVGEKGAVLYPAHRQARVPLAFPGNETPDPLPTLASKVVGYPLTATFPPGVAVPAAEGVLEDEDGQDVPVWFSTPTRPANERFPSSQQNTVCLFARAVLRPGTRYVVWLQGRANGADWARVWTFTTVGPAEVRSRPSERAAARLNRFRAQAGLRPVPLDPALTRACLAHAAYLARHWEHTPGIDVNQERADLPGSTDEGRALAPRTAVRVGGGLGPREAVDWMLSSVPNRALVLNPSLAGVGFGAALHSPRGWIMVASLPVGRGAGEGPRAVLHPGPGQADVPLFFGRDVAELGRGVPRGAVGGYAVTAAFSPADGVAKVKASLSGPGGQGVGCWLSSPANPLGGMGGANQVVLVPRRPLAAATTFTVSMSAEVAGRPWAQTWRFTTEDPERRQAETARAVVEGVNRARALAGLGAVRLDADLSRGCAAHAGYVVRNLDHPKVQGLGVHQEDAGLPGATPAGAKAGRASVIAVLADPLDSADSWLATLYHRIPLLDPGLKRVGYGQAQHPTRGWVTVLDTGNGK